MTDQRQTVLFEVPDDIRQGREPTFKPIEKPIWTEAKSALVARYLYYFVMITKHGTYIDGFAGPQKESHLDAWSARRVLESRPRWLRSFILCDRDPAQVQRIRDMVDAQPPREPKEPKREVEVLPGDFNQLVGDIVERPSVRDTVATFCLLDQRTTECHWSTVQALAAAREAEYKTELFYFLAVGWLGRSLRARTRNQEPADLWWGSGEWETLIGMRQHQMAQVARQRFLDELGYRSALAWPIYGRRSGGRIMYYMIHATDHPDAPNLMSRAYRTATSRAEPMEELQLEFELFRAPDPS